MSTAEGQYQRPALTGPLCHRTLTRHPVESPAGMRGIRSIRSIGSKSYCLVMLLRRLARFHLQLEKCAHACANKGASTMIACKQTCDDY